MIKENHLHLLTPISPSHLERYEQKRKKNERYNKWKMEKKKRNIMKKIGRN